MLLPLRHRFGLISRRKLNDAILQRLNFGLLLLDPGSPNFALVELLLGVL